jgi:hypothetical protein
MKVMKRVRLILTILTVHQTILYCIYTIWTWHSSQYLINTWKIKCIAHGADQYCGTCNCCNEIDKVILKSIKSWHIQTPFLRQHFPPFINSRYHSQCQKTLIFFPILTLKLPNSVAKRNRHLIGIIYLVWFIIYLVWTVFQLGFKNRGEQERGTFGVLPFRIYTLFNAIFSL